MLGTILVVFAILIVGAVVGGGSVAWTNRHRPTFDQLALANKLYQAKTESLKQLCHEAKTGIDLIASHVNVIQSTDDSGQVTQVSKINDAIGALQAMLQRKAKDGQHLTPFEEFTFRDFMEDGERSDAAR